MPVTLEQHETHSLIRLDSECTVSSAAELKRLLLEVLTSGKDLHLDLERAAEFDLTAMQLLWAAGREAARSGGTISIRKSEAAEMAARDAGFECFPGLDV